jgi:arginyl-tRNA synthetase
MTHILSDIKEQIADKLTQALSSLYPASELRIGTDDLVYPPQSDMGDLSLPCFRLAKEAGKSPASVASDLVGAFGRLESIAATRAQGPYFNIVLRAGFLSREIIGAVFGQGEDYGKSDDQGSKILLEFSNANTHKLYHIGHLRNLVLGDAVARLLAANGHKSIPVSYINDFGSHVAKNLWHYSDYARQLEADTGKRLEDLPDDEKGWHLGQIYAKASEKAKDDPTAKGMIEFIMKKLESREGEEYELWQKTREWSIAHFARIYKELGVEFRDIFYENEFIEEGREMVRDLLARGVLRESEGAVIADLEEYGLGVLVVIRSDGTAMYPVADLPLARTKIEKYAPDVSVYVVDVRQGLYFKQLFKLTEFLGFDCQMRHLGYEFVKLPSGMMSSRSGNIISYDELKAKLRERAVAETRERHPDWEASRTEEVARVLAVGAIKFEMCKVGAGQIITFDIDKALQFEGYTAAYLEYTYARSQSIRRKAEAAGIQADRENYDLLAHDKEKDLLFKLARYPEVIQEAARVYDPSVMAKYLFDLARVFNDYYHAVPVIQDDKRMAGMRLSLVLAVSQVVSNGLRLLGIEPIDEM